MNKGFFSSFFNMITTFLWGASHSTPVVPPVPTGQLEDDSYLDDETSDYETDSNEEDEKMSKFSVSVGINDYKGSSNDLSGCVNDANDWSIDILTNQFHFNNVKSLSNSQATISEVTKAWELVIDEAISGDLIVLTYSGHGTTVRDINGDEEDGRDEAICLYDGNLSDDSIRSIFSKKKEGVKLVFISDSCHSGTVTRAFMETISSEEYSKARFLPPEDDIEAFSLSTLPVSKKSVFSPTEDDMNHILISGCLPTEYSYDARFNGRYSGAMTYCAVKILKENPTLTYAEFYKKLRKALPSSRYPQTPCLEGQEASKNSLMFS